MRTSLSPGASCVSSVRMLVHLCFAVAVGLVAFGWCIIAAVMCVVVAGVLSGLGGVGVAVLMRFVLYGRVAMSRVASFVIGGGGVCGCFV